MIPEPNNSGAPPIYPAREDVAPFSDMRAYDELPNIVRKALREAPFDLSAERMLEGWDGNGGAYSANQCVAEIKEANSKLLAAATDEQDPRR